ncbi:MAG: hypothetical protein QME51_09340, partial [Planctomycetota bacterium]|nr:hypothetical protein [Planctomycetota bacterium]
LKRALRMEKINRLPKEKAIKKLEEIATEIRNFSGSPDFLKTGKDTRELNVLLMFFNARLQGATQDIARLLGQAEGGGKAAAIAWARLGTIVGIPALTLAFHNLTNKKNKEDYEKVPQWERENYFMIPREGYTEDEKGNKIRNYWKIPKSETIRIIANLTESTVKFGMETNPNLIWNYAIDFLETISPLNIQGKNLQERVESIIGNFNPLIKAPVEYGIGRNTFYHTDTVPERLKKVSPELQYRKDTPALYKKIGKTFKVSPLLVEQFVRSATAGLFSNPLKSVIRRYVRSKGLYDSEEENIKKALLNQEDIKLLRRERAKQMYEEYKVLVLPTQKKARIKEWEGLEETDPLLYDDLVDEILKQKRGLTYTDILMKQLNVENEARAKYIYEKTKTMNTKERRKYLQELAKKEIFTEKVAEQYLELLKKGKR